MSKRLDPDIKALRACVRALPNSSSKRMLRANLEYLWDFFVAHPPSTIQKWNERKDREAPK